MAGENGHEVLTVKEAASLLRMSERGFVRLLKLPFPKGPPRKRIGGSDKRAGIIRFPTKKFRQWAGLE